MKDGTEHPSGTCFALVEASSLLQHSAERLVRTEGGLSFVQFRILATLTDTDRGVRMTDLAEQLVLSRSGLTYQADALERKGLLQRTQSTDDERSIEAAITPPGRDLVQRLLPQYLETVRNVVLAHLSETEIQQFLQALSRARDSMRTGSA